MTLRGLGHNVFLDQRVLKVGDPLIKGLQNALDTSQAGILIWTNATRDSEWVEREYEVLEKQATEKKGFQFVPIKLDASKLPSFAERRIFLDFSSYPDGPNGGELLRLLHAVVGIPLSDEAAHFATEQDEEAMVASARITAAIKNKYKDRLIKLFEDGGLPWETTSMLGCKAAEGLIRLDANNEAIRMLETLEKRFSKAVRPQQLHALALARTYVNPSMRYRTASSCSSFIVRRRHKAICFVTASWPQRVCADSQHSVNGIQQPVRTAEIHHPFINNW